MEGTVLGILTTKASLDIGLHLCLHNAAYGYNISTDACIYKIVLDFTFNSLGHFTRINVVDVIFDLLNFQSLIKTSPGSMFLRIENSRSAINIDASIWCLPLAIDKADNDL